MKIKSVKIEDLRGIRQAIEFPFKKGRNYTSLAIYGRNGTGKSSVVDAWEWVHNYKIQHLAREGSGAEDYPHKDSDGSNSYVELEFDDEQNNIKFQFDNTRITHPIITGNYDDFKVKVPYPCHLRYRDLQTFVYFSKTEKYNYLAKYLGFELALSIQNNLNTYSNNLQSKIDNSLGSIRENNNRLEIILGEGIKFNRSNILNFVNDVCKKQNVRMIDNFSGIKLARESLKKVIEENPKTIELAKWKEFKRNVIRFFPIESIKGELSRLETLFTELHAEEGILQNISKIKLYEHGLEILSKEKDTTICPLCDEIFGDGLVNHITQKHQKLESLV